MTPSIPNRRAFALAVCLTVTASSCSNFHTIEPGRAYRCGQLEAGQLAATIDEYSIQTVLRLRGGGPGEPTFEQSRDPTIAKGIEFVHVPMTATSMPTREVLIALWNTFATAQYPLLLHCRAGADRSGLASAVYVLHRTGDLRLAKEQLHTFPYWHLGWGRADAMDRVLEQYEPFHGVIDFGTWAEREYDPDR